MDEKEFRQLLELFPVVRSREYHAESDVSRQSFRSPPSQEVQEWQDAWSSDDKNATGSPITLKANFNSPNQEAFWAKLKLAAEQKVGEADAERFCKAFEQAYKKLVYEELTRDDARRIISSRTP